MTEARVSNHVVPWPGERVALAVMRPSEEPADDRDAPDVAAIRERLGLSQAQFAETFGLTLATVERWERQPPSGHGRTLLILIDRIPEAIRKALAGEVPVVKAPTSERTKADKAAYAKAWRLRRKLAAGQ